MAIFVTGTDTNVGKTLIAAWICLHTRAAYFKPIQTGLVDGKDSDVVKKITQTKIYPEAYTFQKPLSPHAAAAAEKTSIVPSSLSLPPEKSLVIEGAGGVLTPIRPAYFMADLMKQWNLPALIVARSQLGAINHTCLTLEALAKRNIKILGVIINGHLNAVNKRAIEDYGRTKVLAEFPQLKSVRAANLKAVKLPQKLSNALKNYL
ncbi:MAG: dethiobiotin synthase [bacterium]